MHLRLRVLCLFPVSKGTERGRENPGDGGAYFLSPAFRRQRQADLCEFEDSLVYRRNSRTARATQRNAVLEGGRGESPV